MFPANEKSPKLPPGFLGITTHITPFHLSSRGVQANVVTESGTGLVIQSLNPSGIERNFQHESPQTLSKNRPNVNTADLAHTSNEHGGMPIVYALPSPYLFICGPRAAQSARLWGRITFVLYLNPRHIAMYPNTPG